MDSKNNSLLKGLKQNQKYTLAAMALLAIVLVVCLILLVIASIDFAGKRDDLSPSANLDNYNIGETSPYTVKEGELIKGSLMVVNKDNKFTLSASDLDLVTLHEYRCEKSGCTSEKCVDHAYITSGYEKDGDIKIVKEAAENLHSMLVDLNKETHSVSYVAVGHRSLTGQESNIPAPSGYSDFHTGLLVNLKAYVGDTKIALELTAQENEAVYSWLLDNAHKYGFVQRYPVGKENATGVSNYLNSFRFVGVAHATYMKANNLCLEEYIEMLAENKPTSENPIKIEVKNGSKSEIYAVYYYDYEGDSANIEVPSKNYTISGTNTGGIVVTVKLK